MVILVSALNDWKVDVSDGMLVSEMRAALARKIHDCASKSSSAAKSASTAASKPANMVSSKASSGPGKTEAFFYAQENGSQTPSSFAHHWLKPQRLRWPDHAKRLLLWADSGGGSLLRLNVSVAVLCERYACDLFLNPSYGTKAMCALDTFPHGQMAAKWSAFKQEYSRQHGGDLGIFPAISALRHIVEESLASKPAAAGWCRVGIVPGEPINRNKVLHDRLTECFQSKRSGGGLSERPQTQAAGVLDLVQRISPKKERCTGENCKRVFSVADKFCPSCGTPNAHFDGQELALTGSGKKPGRVKSMTPEVKYETAGERRIAAATADCCRTPSAATARGSSSSTFLFVRPATNS